MSPIQLSPQAGLPRWLRLVPGRPDITAPEGKGQAKCHVRGARQGCKMLSSELASGEMGQGMGALGSGDTDQDSVQHENLILLH